jgi:phage major head subunit gpT-like protein
MAIIDNSTLEDLNKAVNDLFAETLNKTPNACDEFTSVVPTNQAIVNFPFLDVTSGMKEWVDNKQIGNIVLRNIPVTIKDWEDTLEIPRNAILDDAYGFYSSVGERLARSGKKLKERRVVAALQGGTADTGFDALATFSTAHTLNPAATQSNNNTGTALSATNFDSSYSQMAALLGSDGTALGILPTHLVVPPQLAKVARDICEAPFLASGATNTYAGLCKVVVVPDLAGQATTWYLMSLDAGTPVVYIERAAPSIVSLTDPTDANVFLQKKYLWSAEARGEARLGPWMLLQRNIA